MNAIRTIVKTAASATLLALLAAVCQSAAAAEVIADFEDFYISGFGSLPAEGNWHGQTGEGGFTSGSVNFTTHWSYDSQWDMESWDGFACSNVTNTADGSYANQYASVTGGGAGGSDNYAIVFDGVPSYFAASRPVLDLDAPAVLAGMYVTNTIYAYTVMDEGNSFAKAFGGPDGTDPDYQKLTVFGLDAAGGETGSVEFMLADFTGETEDDDILDAWSWMSLESLGLVSGLRFEISGTDVGRYGMNTPSYFAIDEITAVPEPASLALLALGSAALLRRRR